MTYPQFFDNVRPVTLYDPLSEFLGSAEGGIIEYRYVDAVKLTGHSCPTVAGAYLMTAKALAALYLDRMPERGAIGVSFAADREDGVTGVMASVATLLTGATGTGGFKGIAGRFDRRALLSFGLAMRAELAVTRLDTGRVVMVDYDASSIPVAPTMRELLQRMLTGQATPDEAREFGLLWQDRVKRVLIDQADSPGVITLTGPLATR